MSYPQSIIRLLLLVACTITCSSCSPERAESLHELNWHPDLHQTIEQLEELLAATEQQQPRNYTSSNLAFAYDASLYVQFDRYLASLPAEKRQSAVDEQRRWLDLRKRITDEAYSEYEGGTLASFAGNRAFIEATKKRIVEIEQRRRVVLPMHSNLETTTSIVVSF